MAQFKFEGGDAAELAANEEEFTGAIVYCPVCATNDDAEKWGVNELECNNCGTTYAVFLDPAKVAEHSMVG